jgi:5-methylcytosine-specific restriction endonuclease McrA
VTKRRSISKALRARVILRQDNKCYICGEPFVEGQQIDIEHPWALQFGGPDTEDDYRAAHYDPCHKRKTAREARDAGHIRRLNGTTVKKPVKPITSAGFDRTKTRRFDGTVKSRTSRDIQ